MKQSVTFKSKVGIGLVLYPSIIMIGVSMLLISENIILVGLFTLLIYAYVIHLLFSTRYTILENTLIIQAGFFYKKQIQIADIKKIIETNNPINGPAASLDRLELYFSNMESVLISPKDKYGFVNCLKEINSGIEFNKN
jgi:hypothetical protein